MLKDFRFNHFRFHFKIKKVLDSPCHSWPCTLTRTSTVRDFSRRNVKISHSTVNPPNKQFIISQLPHGENYQTGKIFNHTVRKIGANSCTVRNVKVTVRKISHRTGTCHWKVPGYERNGEPYTFFKFKYWKQKF
jgi:hypothetical protein